MNFSPTGRSDAIIRNVRKKEAAINLNTIRQGDTDALSLEGVSLRFGDLAVLTDINLKINIGERRALLGVNGAGKTTLLSLISGDLQAGGGRILFFGRQITSLSPHARSRSGLRRTYQISLLFGSLSVIDNLYLACKGVSSGRFSFFRPGPNDKTLREAEDILCRMSLESVRHVEVSMLSHGQQRQLEVGMALAGKPRFILFDEPAAGLSVSERQTLTDILSNLDVGYLLVEHDLDIALRVADRVTILHDGKIFKEGLPAEIEKDPDVQTLYLGKAHERKTV